MITKETIEKLKTTWTAFGGLSKEEQKFLLAHKQDVGSLFNDGTLGWFGLGYCPGSSCVYRLRPDFQWKEPKQKQKPEQKPERWAFNTEDHRIVKLEIEICNEMKFNGWIEITTGQKAYLETEPKTELGFKWIKKVTEHGDTVCGFCGTIYTAIVGAEHTQLGGVRWVRVPVAKPSLRDAAQRAVDCWREGLMYNDTMLALEEALKGKTK